MRSTEITTADAADQSIAFVTLELLERLTRSTNPFIAAAADRLMVDIAEPVAQRLRGKEGGR